MSQHKGVAACGNSKTCCWVLSFLEVSSPSIVEGWSLQVQQHWTGLKGLHVSKFEVMSCMHAPAAKVAAAEAAVQAVADAASLSCVKACTQSMVSIDTCWPPAMTTSRWPPAIYG